MALLSDEQIARLAELVANGVVRVRAGDMQVDYASLTDLRVLLEKAEAEKARATEHGGRVFAEFARD
jgi:hypothetical protein